MNKIIKKVLALVIIICFITTSYSIATTNLQSNRVITDETIMYKGSFDYMNYSNVSLAQKIYTSKGRVYNVSEWNLQHAIWDLNSTTGGIVWIPPANITLTKPLRGINSLSLIGSGVSSTILFGSELNFYNLFECNIMNMKLSHSTGIGLNISETEMTTVANVYIIGSVKREINRYNAVNVSFITVPNGNVSDTIELQTYKPANPKLGSLWLNSTTGKVAIYYNGGWMWNISSGKGAPGTGVGDGAGSISPGDRGKWNNSVTHLNLYGAIWNATSAGNFAPNVTYIYNSRGLKFPVTNVGLQSAINDLNGTVGGTVWIPPGNIPISSPIRIPDDVSLVGSGIGNVTYLKCLNSVTTSMIKIYDGATFSLENLFIDARAKTAGAGFENACAIYGIKIGNGSYIRNTVINGSNGNGIYFDGCHRGVVIENVEMNNIVNTGIKIDNSNVLITHCRLSGCTIGIGIEGGNASIENCCLNKTIDNINLFYVKGGFVRNNRIEGTAGLNTGINAWVKNMIISDNYFFNSAIEAIIGSFENTIISGNVIIKFSTGILFEETVQNSKFINNKIYSCTGSAIDSHNLGAGNVRGNNTISFNDIQSATNYGINLKCFNYSIVNFNSIKNCGQAIIETGATNSKTNLYMGNSLVGNTINTISCVGSQNNTFMNLGYNSFFPTARPVNPRSGMTFWNESRGRLEIYNTSSGMWVTFKNVTSVVDSGSSLTTAERNTWNGTSRQFNDSKVKWNNTNVRLNNMDDIWNATMGPVYRNKWNGTTNKANATMSQLNASKSMWNNTNTELHNMDDIWNASSGPVYRNKWNTTTLQLNNTILKVNRTIGFGNKYNSSITQLNLSKANWNGTRNHLQTFGILWNNSIAITAAERARWNGTTNQFNASRDKWNRTTGFSNKWNSSVNRLNLSVANWNGSRTLLGTFGLLWNTSLRKLSFMTKWNNSDTKSNRTSGFGNKWNQTTSGFNNSKSWWATWNSTLGPIYRNKWNGTTIKVNNTATRVNNSAGYGHNWNTTTTQMNKTTAWWAGWNATNGGNYAPNVTFVTNSNGYKYDATNLGLKMAIDNLNNLTGWVDGGNNNISITTTVVGSNNLEFRNVILFLANTANCTLFVANNHSKIINCKFDQNCWQQDAYYGSTTNMHEIISIHGAHDVQVLNSNFKRGILCGIFVGGKYTHGTTTSNVTIDNCKFYDMGAHVKTHSLFAYFASSVFFSYTPRSIISNCYSYNAYSCGYITQYGGTAEADQEAYWTQNFIINNCIAEGGCFGFYAENAKDGMITNCIALNVLDDTIYTYSAGFYALNCHDIAYTGCIAKNCTTNTVGSFQLICSNVSITNCKSINSGYRGMVISSGSSITGCSVERAGNAGIYAYGQRITIVGNKINNSGGTGIYYGSDFPYMGGIISSNVVDNSVSYGIYVGVENTTVIANNIKGTDSYGILVTKSFCKLTDNIIYDYTTYGICFSDNLNNMTIDGNTIHNVAGATGIRLRTMKNSTITQNRVYGVDTGISEEVGSNQNIITGNNLLGCTTAMTLVGMRDLVRNNMGYYSFFDIINYGGTTAGYSYFNDTTGKLGIYSATLGRWVWNISSGKGASGASGTGAGNNLTVIFNSKGYSFPFTEAGFYSAYRDLNTTSGGWVQLPVGILTFTHDINLLNNREIRGAGMNLTRILFGAGMEYGFIALASSGKTAFKSNITIRDLMIDAQANAKTCFYMNRVWHSNFINLRINGSTQWLVYVEYTSKYLHFDNVHFTGFRDKDTITAFQALGASSCEQCIFENLYFYNQSGGANVFDLTRSRNCTVDNIIIKGANQSGLKLAGTLEMPSRNINVNNVFVSDCHGSSGVHQAVYVSGYISNVNLNNIIINNGSFFVGSGAKRININNVVVNNSLASGMGFYIHDASDVMLNNVIVNRTAYSAIYLEGANNITFSNTLINKQGYRTVVLDSTNIKFLNTKWIGGRATVREVQLDNTNYITFDNCFFFDSVEDGIGDTTTTSKNITITNSLFLCGVQGIDLTLSCSNIFILTNTFKAQSNDGISIGSSNRFVFIIENRITGSGAKGIDCSGTNCSIANNIIDVTADDGIEINGNGCICIGNILKEEEIDNNGLNNEVAHNIGKVI